MLDSMLAACLSLGMYVSGLFQCHIDCMLNYIECWMLDCLYVARNLSCFACMPLALVNVMCMCVTCHVLVLSFVCG